MARNLLPTHSQGPSPLKERQDLVMYTTRTRCDIDSNSSSTLHKAWRPSILPCKIHIGKTTPPLSSKNPSLLYSTKLYS